MAEKFIAFDIGGTKVKHGLLHEDGTFIEKNSYQTVTSDINRFLEDMVSTIKSYQIENVISGIGISLPGFISIETGYAETAGNVTALKGKSIKDLLAERVNIPVEVENDGNCVALAEKLNGNAIDSNNFICLTIGTGIGGGIFIDGKIFRGHSFRGGEFGFMVTHKGNKDKEIWHHNGSTKSLIDDYKKLKGLDSGTTVEGTVIFKEAKQEEHVNNMIEEWLEYISCGIYNLAVTLNPEKILIGGAVSERDDLIKRIEGKLEELHHWQDFRVPIVRCKHKNDAGLLGALKHFSNRH